MNVIEIKTTSLKTDKNALYKDIFVDDSPFQELLKESYQKEFATGRFKETFIPCLMRPKEDSTNTSNLPLENPLPANKNILPLYGCQDGCCIYVYVLISKENKEVIWEKVGRNSTYIKESKNSEEKIEWLADFSSLHFNETDYKNTLHQLK
jgi:hypothetical protein